MSVEVKVTATLQKVVGGQRSVQGDGATVREVLEDLDRKHPGIMDMVMVDGQIHRFVNIYLNDEDVRFLDKLDTRLKEGDILSILPALAGGARWREPILPERRDRQPYGQSFSSVPPRLVSEDRYGPTPDGPLLVEQIEDYPWSGPWGRTESGPGGPGSVRDVTPNRAVGGQSLSSVPTTEPKQGAEDGG